MTRPYGFHLDDLDLGRGCDLNPEMFANWSPVLGERGY